MSIWQSVGFSLLGMENLCLKGGLPRDAWKSGAELWTFQSIHFRESEFR
jgi:AMMECR1 domain-containing protein